MMTIAVDAMGGDCAPKPEVEGAILAASQYPVRVILVGPKPRFSRAMLSIRTACPVAEAMVSLPTASMVCERT